LVDCIVTGTVTEAVSVNVDASELISMLQSQSLQMDYRFILTWNRNGRDFKEVTLRLSRDCTAAYGRGRRRFWNNSDAC
jgi:hypothetical protein